LATRIGDYQLLLWHQLLAISHNWHRVDDNFFRSAQMYGDYLTPLLQREKIASIINLRGENPKSSWYGPEQNICKKLGIAHIDSPLHSRRLPKQEMLLKLLRAFSDAPPPILVKCSGGADRTALASALYLLNTYGLDGAKKATHQMKFFPYLHLPGPHQRWIRQFPNFFSETQHGYALFNWVEKIYTPRLFSSWLKENNLDGTWRE
jgi:hypothetical protein